MSEGPVWIDDGCGGSFHGGVDPRDRGLTLGDGIFDTLVAFRGLPFAGVDHLERLYSQADTIGIRIDPERVRAGWNAVLENAGGEPVILRTTVTRGPGARGLWPHSETRATLPGPTLPGPTLIVAATAWDRRLFAKPLRLITSAISRNPGSPSSHIKSLGYLDNILAAREAAEKGGDDALLLTPSGRVACTTIANIFAIAGDRLTTPPLTDAVQPGIMRRLVLASAESGGLKAEERSLTPRELSAADQVFLTNSVRFLFPCLSLDGHPLSQKGAHKLTLLTDLICAQVAEACGFNPIRSIDS